MADFFRGKPSYLLFLKHRKDGRYQPVTGQFDSALSCKEIINGGTAEPFGEEN